MSKCKHRSTNDNGKRELNIYRTDPGRDRKPPVGGVSWCEHCCEDFAINYYPTICPGCRRHISMEERSCWSCEKVIVHRKGVDKCPGFSTIRCKECGQMEHMSFVCDGGNPYFCCNIVDICVPEVSQNEPDDTNFYSSENTNNGNNKDIVLAQIKYKLRIIADMLAFESSLESLDSGLSSDHQEVLNNSENIEQLIENCSLVSTCTTQMESVVKENETLIKQPVANIKLNGENKVLDEMGTQEIKNDNEVSHLKHSLQREQELHKVKLRLPLTEKNQEHAEQDRNILNNQRESQEIVTENASLSGKVLSTASQILLPKASNEVPKLRLNAPVRRECHCFQRPHQSVLPTGTQDHRSPK